MKLKAAEEVSLVDLKIIVFNVLINIKGQHFL
jgi:hypothetical protein